MYFSSTDVIQAEKDIESARKEWDSVKVPHGNLIISCVMC